MDRTQQEFEGEDFEKAEVIARALGLRADGLGYNWEDAGQAELTEA